ncbi:MAG TPA: DUF6298 domain-containing protein [Acidobacteriaceae bacterium]|nr:DUF6298 domain-containing protein [Acidobacteriaceae bacterium]
MLRGRACIAALILGSAASGLAQGHDAVKIDPQNPKYLLFRGKPLALISASEHYGSIINRPFDFKRYLDDAAEHKMTMTRTFLLYRELQSARNPSSPCKPESPDYISPFMRTGPLQALDGEPIYDLDHWNPEYFDRLHQFLDAASQKGIVVELTVFSNTYADNIWALNPLRRENNRQQVGDVAWEDYTSLKDPDLVRRQSAFARKIIQETSQYDNVYYEICNEPGGGVPGHATPAEVDAWQQEMARVMRAEMQRLGRPHLLSGQQAFTYGAKNVFPLDASFAGSIFDIVNDHPLPNTRFDGHIYDMGSFMSKELKLGQIASFCRAAYPYPKPTALDEDNAASLYRDETGWTIHRKRSWTALLSGCHYDFIDFSITVGNEGGTPASQREIRTWIQHLSEFMRSFDLIGSRPDITWISGYPADLVVSGLSVSGRDYVAYLADARELTDPAAGNSIAGSFSLSLPSGSYDVSLYSPVTGESSPAMPVKGGSQTVMVLPSFRQDIVVLAKRRDK